MEAIITGVVAGVVLAVILGSYKAWVVERAKVHIQLKQGSPGSSHHSHTQNEVHWNYSLDLHNLTASPATEIELLYRSSPVVDLNWPSHVDGLQSVKVENKLVQLFPKQQVAGGNIDFWGKMYPDELRNLEVILKYRNRLQLPFYTSYKKTGGKETVRYSRVCPLRAVLLKWQERMSRTLS